VILAAIACKHASIAGTYKGDKTTIVLKEDGTFSTKTGQGETLGKWVQDKKKVTLSIETVGGKPLSQAIDDVITQKKVPASMADRVRAQIMQGAHMEGSVSDDEKSITFITAGAGSNTTTVLKKV